MDITLTVFAYILIVFAILYDIFTLIGMWKRKKAGVLEIRRPISISVSFTVLSLVSITFFTIANYFSEIELDKYRFALFLFPLACVFFVLWDTWGMTLDGDKIGVRRFFRVKYYSLQDILYDKTRVYYRGKKIFTLDARYFVIPAAFEWQLQQREKFQISQVTF